MHMNELSGKRVLNGPLVKKRGLSDIPNGKDESIQLCPRNGCSGRLNCTRTGGCIPKPYSTKQSSNPSSVKEGIASSSRTSSLTGKPHTECHRKPSSHIKPDQSEAKTFQNDILVQKQTASSRYTESRKSTVWETGCSSGLSGSKNQPTQHDNKFKSANQKSLRTRTPKCSPSASSSLAHSSESRFMRKRSSQSESSSSSSSVRNKTSNQFTKEGRGLLNNRGVLISDVNNNAVFGSNVNSRVRSRDQNSRLLRPNTPNAHMLNSTFRFSTDISPSESSSYSVPGTDDDNSIHNLLHFPSVEFNIGQTNNRDGLWRYNMDEISGALSQLERIENDEALTYEQLLAHESNVFLSGISFFDHHRDMRLDIDDMSYEELLALGERMGTVSTALSEEAMSKCIRRSIHQVSFKVVGIAGLKGDEDDNKCCICQEEYALGDEIGKLECEHRYHLGCIQKWLRMKNWCPICKASADRSSQP
ncbi:unnamed protein product [Cuscuta epithymum]|uniref:RING-type E3 ubiquitin transferase n=1 Tax=Cuscuta epithymum TaxID=186058 RepID=A0AAV0DQU8_9ASTE|nr:unnamed protein product [Cuscuta epithymum]